MQMNVKEEKNKYIDDDGPTTDRRQSDSVLNTLYFLFSAAITKNTKAELFFFVSSFRFSILHSLPLASNPPRRVRLLLFVVSAIKLYTAYRCYCCFSVAGGSSFRVVGNSEWVESAIMDTWRCGRVDGWREPNSVAL